jgi:hypothetical protein
MSNGRGFVCGASARHTVVQQPPGQAKHFEGQLWGAFSRSEKLNACENMRFSPNFGGHPSKVYGINQLIITHIDNLY